MPERPHPPEGNQPAAGPDPRPGDPPEPGHEPGEQQVGCILPPVVKLTKTDRVKFYLNNVNTKKWSTLPYLDLLNGLLSSHLKGVSVLGTQKELHLGAGRK